MAIGGCISLRIGPIPDLKTGIVLLLGERKLIGLRVIANGVIIDPLLGPSNGVGKVLLKGGILVAGIKVAHHDLNYKPTANKMQTII
jgi:hypothetical protein